MPHSSKCAVYVVQRGLLLLEHLLGEHGVGGHLLDGLAMLLCCSCCTMLNVAF